MAVVSQASSRKEAPWWATTVPFSQSIMRGRGNDIILTVTAAPVPEPSTWIGGVLAIAGLAFTQRRRLRKVPILRDMFR